MFKMKDFFVVLILNCATEGFEEQMIKYCFKKMPHYTCLVNTSRQDASYEWFQSYPKSNYFIGPKLNTTGKNSAFVIKLERFDNNSIINALFPTFGKTAALTGKITVFPNELAEDYNISTQRRFTDSEAVTFGCQQYYEHTHVGFINTTQNLISTRNERNVEFEFNMDYHGTILCCIYYKNESLENGIQITRYIENKTLLIYDNKSPSKNIVGGFGNEAKFNYTIIYVGASLIGVAIIILLSFITLKKLRYRNTNNELETYHAGNRVIYAELDISKGGVRRPDEPEETHYAKIIGVLKPKEDNIYTKISN